jgi:hypothetical protein
MRNRTLLLSTIAAIVVLTGSRFAGAASQRTFVSTSGVDNLTCSLVAPCRTFDAAIGATSAGGEVIVLDSGGYGATTISQSISIIAPSGIYAGISSFSGAGIHVNGIGAIVVLRGLSINSQGGSTGIFVSSAAKVQIENCVINGFGAAVRFHPSAPGTLILTDTILRNNGGGGLIGFPLSGGELSTIDITRSVIHANGAGVFIRDFPRASIVDTLVADNDFDGISASSSLTSSMNPSLAIDRSQIAGNVANGLHVDGTSVVTTVVNVSKSTISNNRHNGVYVGTRGYVRLSENQLTGNQEAGAVVAGTGVVATMHDNLDFGNGIASSPPTTITPY